MTTENRLFYQEAIARATKDIHNACRIEIDLLWDEGTSYTADAMHRVKIWNGLGSLYFLISHRDLVEGGSGYRRFLDDLSATVNHRLTLQR
jgi:hypothetical protein